MNGPRYQREPFESSDDPWQDRRTVESQIMGLRPPLQASSSPLEFRKAEKPVCARQRRSLRAMPREARGNCVPLDEPPPPTNTEPKRTRKPRGPCAFTERDVKAAIRAAKAAGCVAPRVIIEPGGKIIIETGETQADMSPLDTWRKAKNHAS